MKFMSQDSNNMFHRIQIAMKSIGTFLVVTTFIFLINTVNAQARLNIKAADSLDFILTLNNNPVNHFPCLSIMLDKLSAGKHNVKVLVPSHPEIVVDQVLTLKKNTTTFLELEKNKGVFKLVMKSESSLPVSNNVTLNQPFNGNQNNPLEANQVSSSNAVAPTTVTTQMQIEDSVYTGKCGMPADPAVYDAMIAEVDKQFFETKKMDLMKGYLAQNCVRVEQLRFMMTKFSQEDNKIELLKASTKRVIDTENLRKVESDFFLERNKARANQIIVENQ